MSPLSGDDLFDNFSYLVTHIKPHPKDYSINVRSIYPQEMGYYSTSTERVLRELKDAQALLAIAIFEKDQNEDEKRSLELANEELRSNFRTLLQNQIRRLQSICESIDSEIHDMTCSRARLNQECVALVQTLKMLAKSHSKENRGVSANEVDGQPRTLIFSALCA